MTAERDTRPVRAPHDRPAGLLFSAIAASLTLGCLAGLWRVTAVLGLRVPLDPNEGWNAYHAAAAMAGQGPYPAASSFMTDNYPPLSFYVVGALGKVFGDNIVAGRILSLLSFAVVAGGIAALARRFGCNLREAAFASLLFAGFLLVYSDYVGMDDPQMFGHALQMCGLLLLFADKRSLSSDLAMAALFAMALFVKHNLVAMPIAAILWLARDDWRRAVRLAVLQLVLGLAGLAACRAAFGFDLLTRLNSARVYSVALLAENFRDWLAPAAVSLATTLAAATTRDRFSLFCALYALVAIVIGGIFLGGAGVDANAMFDADIAISLGAGLALDRVRLAFPHRHGLAGALLALVLVAPLAAGLARAFDPGWLERDFWVRPMRDDAETARADIAYLRSRKGPAFCEMLSLCYWAGKAGMADAFNLDQQFLTGARDEGPFLRTIGERNFAVLQFDSLSPFAFPPNVKAMIARGYRVERTSDDGVFMARRPTN